MSNKKNNRRKSQKKRSEKYPCSKCEGSGKGGAKGRAKWNRIASRKERRSEAGKGLPPRDRNRIVTRRPFIRPSISEE